MFTSIDFPDRNLSFNTFVSDEATPVTNVVFGITPRECRMGTIQLFLTPQQAKDVANLLIETAENLERAQNGNPAP